MRLLLIAYLVMSFVTFCAYAVDKFKARHAMWRTSEKTLHILELCCGWPGAMLAHRYLRHKSCKPSFRRTFWCMVFANVLGLVLCLRGFL